MTKSLVCTICGQEYQRGKYVNHEMSPKHKLAVAAAREAATPKPKVLGGGDGDVLEFVLDKTGSAKGQRIAAPIVASKAAAGPLLGADATQPSAANPLPPPPPAAAAETPAARAGLATVARDGAISLTMSDAAAPPSAAAEDFIALGGAVARSVQPVAPAQEPPRLHQERPRPPWLRESPYSAVLSERLHQEICDYVRYSSPHSLEHASRQHVIELVRQVTLRVWPSAKVVAFGSYDTQLYLPTSDLDLVVVGSLGANPLRLLAQALRDANLTAKMELIEKARVPIIKMVDSVVGYNVDISFNVTSGVDSARIVKEALALFPAIRPLMMVIKEFLHERHLNEVFSGGLGSYSLTMMILSFLQLHPRVQTREIDPSENLGVLLIEFFELYGRSFANPNIGIAVVGGGSYYRSSRSPGGYYNRPSTLSLQDPQDPSNDISRGSFNYATVKLAFAHAFNLLTSELLHYRNRASLSGAPSSILNLIIRCDPQTAAAREARLARIRQLDVDLSVYPTDLPCVLATSSALARTAAPLTASDANEVREKLVALRHLKRRHSDSESDENGAHDSSSEEERRPHQRRRTSSRHDNVFVHASSSESDSDNDAGGTPWRRRSSGGSGGAPGAVAGATLAEVAEAVAAARVTRPTLLFAQGCHWQWRS